MLLVILFMISFLVGNAQHVTTDGPEIGMDEGARVTVLGEDEDNIYFCSVNRGYFGGDDVMFVTVYDKKKRSVVIEHEIDEDYGFTTAFMQGDNVVLAGSTYNKKTKSVEFFQYAFPVMNKRKGKIESKVVYSVPAQGTKYNWYEVLRSADGQVVAYLTYLRPSSRDAEEYTLDVMVCGIGGNEIAHTQEKIHGECPNMVKGFLADNGTVYVEEHYRTNQKVSSGGTMLMFSTAESLRYVTITADKQIKPVQLEPEVESIGNSYAELLADQRLMVFGSAKGGVGMFVLDKDGEVAKYGIYEGEIPNLPENVKYDYDFYNENRLSFKPYQILSLQDGRVLVLAHQHMYSLVSNGNSVRSYNDHKNLYLYLFDEEMEPVAFVTRPYGSQSSGDKHEDLPVALEWGGELRLLFNGQVSNYTGKAGRVWKVLNATKMEERCLVLGVLDNELQFDPKIIRQPAPKKPFTSGEYFEQLLKVTEDAVYIINHINIDNFIEEIEF